MGGISLHVLSLTSLSLETLSCSVFKSSVLNLCCHLPTLSEETGERVEERGSVRGQMGVIGRGREGGGWKRKARTGEGEQGKNTAG